MNEERKQGKNKGKNKQTDEQPKHTFKYKRTQNEHIHKQVNGRMKGRKRKNKQWYKWYENPVQYINPLTPKQHLVSPYNITTESDINVMRIKEMITN